VKDGSLMAVYGQHLDKNIVLAENNVDTAVTGKAVSSRENIYFLDSSSVLWKIAKKGNVRESLGFASLTGLFEEK
jgi:hypothetical protein